MRGLMVAMLCGVLIGCGGSDFKSESDELTYLSSVANPSPQQWKRKNELIENRIKARDAEIYAARSAPRGKAAGRTEEQQKQEDKRIFELIKESAREDPRFAPR